jgi:hypothetical protein
MRDIVMDAPLPPTTTATTPATEPEVIAGVSSAEGQPAEAQPAEGRSAEGHPAALELAAGGPSYIRPGLLLLGGALLGAAAVVGLTRFIRPAA